MKFDRFKTQINYRTPNMYVKGTHSKPFGAVQELVPLLTNDELRALRASITPSDEIVREVSAYIHTVVSTDGDEQDFALSFLPDSFPLDSLGWRSIQCQPLFTNPPKVSDASIALCHRMLAYLVQTGIEARKQSDNPLEVLMWDLYAELSGPLFRAGLLGAYSERKK